MEFTEQETYDLKMIIKEHLDELPDLIEINDGGDKEEMVQYRKRIQALYDKIAKN